MPDAIGFSEAQWEEIALDALGVQEWQPLPGAAIAPGTENGRESWEELHLPGRLLEAMRRLNPQVPGQYLQQAQAEILSAKSQDAIAENHRIHAFNGRSTESSVSRASLKSRLDALT